MGGVGALRRFRNSFYDKVGLSDRAKVGPTDVSEKTRLQELLAQNPLPVERIVDFCCCYKVPDQYRILVWKLVLNLVSKHASSCEFVQKQRAFMYWDAWRVLLALRLRSVEWHLLSHYRNRSNPDTRISTSNSRRSSGGGADVDNLLHLNLVVGRNVITKPYKSSTMDVLDEQPLFEKMLALMNVIQRDSTLTALPETEVLPLSLSQSGSSLYSQSSIVSPAAGASFKKSSNVTNGHHRHHQEECVVENVQGEHLSSNGIARHRTRSSLEGRSSSGTSSSGSETIADDNILIHMGLSLPVRSSGFSVDTMMDAKIFGVYTLKTHYVGFHSSNNNNEIEWDYDAVELSPEEAVPSVVDMLLMWMMNRGNLSHNYHTSQIVNNPDNAAYISIGSHLNSDSNEETFALRFAVWDLVSTHRQQLMEAVLVNGKTLLASHSVVSTNVYKVLDSLDFFNSPYLKFLAISLFSNILSPVSAEKVLDKILVKGFNYLSFLFLELILQVKNSLMSAKSSDEAVKFLVDMKPLESEYAVNASLEIWHKDQFMAS